MKDIVVKDNFSETYISYVPRIRMTKLIYYYEKRMVDTITDGHIVAPTD